ncbi:unnamed protein product, partial [Amoebophrya sp. A25]
IPDLEELTAGTAASALGLVVPKPQIHWAPKGAVAGVDTQDWRRVSGSSVAAANMFEAVLPSSFFDTSVSGKMPLVEYDSTKLCKILNIGQAVTNLTKPGAAFGPTSGAPSSMVLNEVCFWVTLKGLFQSEAACLRLDTDSQLHLSMNMRTHDSLLDSLLFSTNFFRYFPGYLSSTPAS